jgi:uncharacterized protein (TIGR00369 family)
VQPLPYTKSCFGCGHDNPIGLRLRLHTDGTKVQTEFTPRPDYAGFKGVIHGGISSVLLDEVMAWACAVATGRFAYCAELSVRFVRPLHPRETVTAHGELTSNKRRVFEARAEILHPTHGLMAAATGKYLPIPEADREIFMQDFAGDPFSALPHPKP